MSCIEREAAIALIEEKQKELCPVGLYGRNYVYGSDREWYDNWNEIIDALEAIPTADVAPVIRGTWQLLRHDKYSDVYQCSECGRRISLTHGRDIAGYYPYCHCGAKMEPTP